MLIFYINLQIALTAATQIKPKNETERMTLAQLINKIYKESSVLTTLGYPLALDAPCYRDILLFYGKHARHQHFQSMKKAPKPKFYGLPWKPIHQLSNAKDITPKHLLPLVQVYEDAVNAFGIEACIHSGIVGAAVTGSLMCDKWYVAAHITWNALKLAKSTGNERDYEHRSTPQEILLNKLLKITLKKMRQYEVANEVYRLDYEAFTSNTAEETLFFHKESEKFLLENDLHRQVPIIRAQTLPHAMSHLSKINKVRRIEKRLLINSIRALAYVFDLISFGKRIGTLALNAQLLKMTKSMHWRIKEFLLEDGYISNIDFLRRKYKKIVSNRRKNVKTYMQEIIRLEKEMKDKVKERVESVSRNDAFNVSRRFNELIENVLLDNDIDEQDSDDSNDMGYEMEDYDDDDDDSDDYYTEAEEWLRLDNEDCVTERDFWH